MTGKPTERRSNNPKAHRKVAWALVALPALMLAMTFAAVPLYRLFCAATGYAGTPRRAEAPSTKVVDRMITIRFDANVSSDLPWTFQPEKRQIELKLGENALAFYEARNLSGAPLTGTASFNVTPESVGSYFNKIACFCFTEQTLQPGQRVDMPVSFFVDPAILDDPEANRIQEITLSYTFFKVNGPVKAAAGEAGKSEAPPSKAPKSSENTGSSG
jgi:cytochrome c oxidase assembly protein subunit 11